MHKSYSILAGIIAISNISARPALPAPPAPPVIVQCYVGKDVVNNGLILQKCSRQPGEMPLFKPRVGEVDKPYSNDQGSYTHTFWYTTKGSLNFETQVCGKGVLDVVIHLSADGVMSGQEIDADRRDCIRRYFSGIEGVYALLIETRAPDTSFDIRTIIGPPPPPPPPPLPPPVFLPLPPPAP